MRGIGLAKGGPRQYVPFHERYKLLLLICSIGGLHVRAIDRILTVRWQRILLRIWSSIIHTILSSIFLSSFVHIFLSIIYKERAAKTVHSILVMGCSTHGVLRQYYMHVNINNYDRLYQKWDELFGKNDPDWKSREDSISFHYKNLKKILLILGGITCVMLTSYPVSNFFSPTKTFGLPTAIPYKHQSPDFEFFMTYYSFGIFIHTIFVGSSQILLLVPTVWELGELYRLQARLKEIFVESEAYGEVATSDGEEVYAKTYTPRGMAAIRKNMKLWVEQHQKVTEFHMMSMKVNNFELGMEMIATFIEACGMAIVAATPNYMPPGDIASNGLAFLAYFSLFYMSCAKCKELSDLSINVADDAYAEDWSAMPLQLKRNFLMILARTMKPLYFYGAYIFIIDIMTFNQIFQTAYSVFNFFFTMVNG